MMKPKRKHVHRFEPNEMFGQSTGFEQCLCGKYRRIEKRKREWKGWAIKAMGVLCGHKKHYEIHATKKQAEAVAESIEGLEYTIVPVTIKERS